MSIESVVLFSVISFIILGISVFILWVLFLMQDKRIKELEEKEVDL